ncbi:MULTISPECIES: carbohydrate ABC transporter permease [Paenibacillus]|jgi:putative aldouronate transport system permease protein|uniref:Binding-protein-dependent transport systems inner membrane component n=3 Tax=Paenibacillus TaxID=44249 RepID=G4H8Q2_9BACL|nr:MULTISPECIES: carbohydrate ABC transporter permease [Paenibacillus]ANY74967.1 sugar ABC transporter permease [Paenibacillus ihbetae]EHB68237.1 binding-protein-dependent transport systems inner membrane component [Paenibacillus lactis 154]MBP1894190.1 putative aldouronate transport system permease protein [Paenibacillus lactis]MCM3492701.1 carbohydrate ABC transporter permease [Paenibacillus lactis]OOC62870.1 sugar ABC transporter permease [Paenibacillus ihbetae]
MQIESRGDRIFNIINYTILILVTLIVLYPLLFVLSASFSDPQTVLRGEMLLWPKGFNLNSYVKIFQNQDIISGFTNTLIYTSLGTLINLTMTILAAYPLSRKDFVGRNAIMALLVFTMFFSGGLIPTYLLIKNLGMLNSLWVMIIPNAVSIWNIIIMRTFFQQSIPNELQEAATIDGCSNIKILTRIILPLSMPIIAVTILFYAVGHWNAFFNALLYLSDKEKFPLQLILREILIQGQTNDMVKMSTESAIKQQREVEGIKYAVLVVANLPVLALYPFLQRYFVKGVMIGAIKG